MRKGLWEKHKAVSAGRARLKGARQRSEPIAEAPHTAPHQFNNRASLLTCAVRTKDLSMNDEAESGNARIDCAGPLHGGVHPPLSCPYQGS
jgi:hypothetical protein